jgi:hypothetical protein
MFAINKIHFDDRSGETSTTSFYRLNSVCIRAHVHPSMTRRTFSEYSGAGQLTAIHSIHELVKFEIKIRALIKSESVVHTHRGGADYEINNSGSSRILL